MKIIQSWQQQQQWSLKTFKECLYFSLPTTYIFSAKRDLQTINAVRISYVNN